METFMPRLIDYPFAGASRGRYTQRELALQVAASQMISRNRGRPDRAPGRRADEPL